MGTIQSPCSRHTGTPGLRQPSSQRAPGESTARQLVGGARGQFAPLERLGGEPTDQLPGSHSSGVAAAVGTCGHHPTEQLVAPMCCWGRGHVCRHTQLVWP